MTQDIKPRPRISSLAAPTADDMAVFDAMTEVEQRAFILAEIDKADGTNAITVTDPDTYFQSIRERTRAKLATAHAHTAD